MTEEELHAHLRQDMGPLPGDEAYIPPVAGVASNAAYTTVPHRCVSQPTCDEVDPISGMVCDQRRFHPSQHVARDEDQTWLWPKTYPTR